MGSYPKVPHCLPGIDTTPGGGTTPQGGSETECHPRHKGTEPRPSAGPKPSRPSRAEPEPSRAERSSKGLSQPYRAGPGKRAVPSRAVPSPDKFAIKSGLSSVLQNVEWRHWV